MTVPILIPARGGSKRVPRKNIRDLCGKPLIAWTIETALLADVGPVVVSTDDHEIGDVALYYGADVHDRMPRSATDAAAMSMVVRDYMRFSGMTSLLLLQPTTPLRSLSTVSCAARAVGFGERVFSVRRAIVSEGHGTDVPSKPIREMSPGVYRVPTVFGYQENSESRLSLLFVERWEAIDIDTEDDFALAEFWMKRKGWA